MTFGISASSCVLAGKFLRDHGVANEDGETTQMARRLFTSESVTEGHPDKVCDQISDSILDAIMTQDPMARVACETAATTNLIALIGEITTSAQIDYAGIALLVATGC